MTACCTNGVKLIGLGVHAQPEHAKEHYSDLSSKPFFGGLVDFICSSPVVAMVWQGERRHLHAVLPVCADELSTGW